MPTEEVLKTLELKLRAQRTEIAAALALSMDHGNVISSTSSDHTIYISLGDETLTGVYRSGGWTARSRGHMPVAMLPAFSSNSGLDS